MIARSSMLLLLLLGSLTACRSPTFVVESRETPVHVWVLAPELLNQGGAIQARVVVDCHELVNGPIRFPPCTPNIALSTLYLTCGQHRVTVEVDGGRRCAAGNVAVEGETWVLITVTRGGVGIDTSDEDPLAPKCKGITIPLLSD